MRKLAFEHAGFEMPSLRMVNLEKENANIVFAAPKTVYKGSTYSYNREAALRAALNSTEKTATATSTWSYTAAE